MKATLTLIVLIVFSLTLASCASTGEKGASSAPSAASSPMASAAESSADVEKALTQMERDWIAAVQKRDTATLDRILADDWTGIGMDGKAYSKAMSIAEAKAQENSLDSITLEPMKVRVFGDMAIVTGGDTEKSKTKGKDSSGRYVWTDVFMKRNGRWQAVASQSTRVEQPKA